MDAKEWIEKYMNDGNVMMGDFRKTPNNIQYLHDYIDKNKDNSGKVDNLIGITYYLGLGRDIDILTAIKYFEMAIEKHNVHAMNNLGFLHFSVEGHKDISKAIKYYEMAIKIDCAKAMNNLGCLYLYEEQKDVPKSIKYFEMAIEKGENGAMLNLGMVYESQYDISKAIKYYEMAIIHGNTQALKYLIKIYSKYCDDTIKYIQMANKRINELEKENDELKTELRYSPDHEGYEEAKSEFERLSER
jgi:TPR repeat protein